MASRRPSNTNTTTTEKEVPVTTETTTETVPTNVVPETVPDDVMETPKPRVSEVLSSNAILADFARQYLEVFDLITDYNKEVLAEKDSEWNPSKILAKARELGQPADANVKPNSDIKTALDKYEDALTAYNQSRKEVMSTTAKVLGISLTATAERNSETEAPLKEKHKFAVEIGTQLSTIAKMLTDEKISEAVTNFLSSNPLPAIGRDQVRTFGSNEKTTPKYRVNVKVIDADGNVKVDEAGFTKASFALTALYERGKAPKSETLRTAWEKAGNTPETTVTNPVEFDDNDLHFVITKK